MKRTLVWTALASLSALLCEGTLAQQAGTLADPRTRNEDISRTRLTASVVRRTDGLYEYTYSLTSPIENKGRIVSFGIDANCDLQFEPVVFPELGPPSSDPRDGDSASVDGKHVPAAGPRVVDSSGQTLAATPIINVKNWIHWAMAMRAGQSISGLRVLSPAPPGPRQYKVGVGMDTFDLAPDGRAWDYSTCDTEAGCPDFPWTDDFDLSGMTTGPACSTGPGPEPEIYAGTLDEPEHINQLLTYTKPLTSQITLSRGQSTLEIEINYSQFIDARTFKVSPGKFSNLFHPAPGTSETVFVPTDSKKLQLKLEVHPPKNKTPRPNDPMDHSYKDTDRFNVEYGN